MNTADSIERYTGAYAIPELVGRTDVLGQIRQALEQPSQRPQVILLFGKGGIGKTRILLESHAQADDHDTLIFGRGLIDLYDVQYHSASGMADAIWQMLTPPYEPFHNYERERHNLLQLQESGVINKIAEQYELMLESFTSDMRAFSERRRVVLLLDTAERLVYHTGPDSGSEAKIAEGWLWLLKSLPRWRNVTVLVASRPTVEAPTDEPLRRLIDEVQDIDVVPIDVGPFSEQESRKYFDAVAQVARDAKEERVATLVANMTPELRDQVHSYAGGRPVLMALLVDLLSVVGLAAIRSAIEEYSATSQPSADMQTQHNKVEQLLIDRLQRSLWLRKTVVALGRAPKGLDSLLLARMLDESIEEAEARLKEVKRLSFVKVRDQRVFLHDEMYAILRRQIYDYEGDAAEAKAPMRAILQYYDLLFERNSQEINKLYESAEASKRDLDKLNLADLISQRRVLLTDYLYYRLRHDPIRGFQYFFRFTFDAIHAGDAALDVQLRAETMAFLRERDPEGKAAFVDGLERAMVTGIATICPVAHAWAQNDHKRVFELASAIRQHKTRLGAAGGQITEASLNIWEARSLTYQGGQANMRQAKEKLDHAITTLEELTNNPDSETAASEARLWRTRALLALGFGVRAYLQRVGGFLQAAVEDYRRSVALWRQAEEPINLALALNDMGFAMAELGFAKDGRALVSDALDLRRRSGPRVLVGLSISTLARIELHEGRYRSAMENAERALRIFEALGNPRGRGLALNALAEAQRRSSGVDLLSSEEKIRLLREARDYAVEALNIFRSTHETVRQVEALIEWGCACRDLARIQRDHPSARGNLARLIDESKQALEAAAERAGDTIHHRKVDALVNLAFLAFYSGQINEIALAVQRAMKAISDEYYINPKLGHPDIEPAQAQLLLWPQLGKLYMLHGHQAFENFSRPADIPEVDRRGYLKRAMENYTLSVEYNKLYSLDHPGLQRAIEQIYSNMKQLEFADLKIASEAVSSVEKSYHLQQSEMQKLLRHRAMWYGD